MQIQVHTDNNITAREDVVSLVQSTVEGRSAGLATGLPAWRLISVTQTVTSRRVTTNGVCSKPDLLVSSLSQ